MNTFRRLYATSLPEWLVIALAALTRLWRLNYHSIWFDESVSLSWAGSDPGYIWRVTFQLVEEKHPPVYYIALHYWRELLGLFGHSHTDAAIRVFGSLLGILTVAGLLLLARRISGRPTGLLAGTLVALSPVLVWYSQEVRMFQPAATGGVWAAYALVRAWEGRRWTARLGWWLLLVLVLEAALYSYLFAAFLLPAAGLTLLALAIAGRRDAEAWRRFGEGVLALAIVCLLFLPLANNAWGVNAAESTPGRAFADFWPNLRSLLKIFTIWRMPWHDAVLWFLGLLALAGLIIPHRPTRLPPSTGWRAYHDGNLPTSPAVETMEGSPPGFTIRSLDDRFWLLIWIGVPLLVANILQASSNSVFKEDRYLIFLAPFVLWAIARGAVVIGERRPAAGWILGGAVSLLLLASLPRLWTPDAHREEWRSAVNYVIDYQEAGDDLPGALVAHIDYTRRPVQWYLQKVDGVVERLPVFHPFGAAIAPEQIDAVVAPVIEGIRAEGAATLWLTQSHLEGVDDERLVEGWLNGHYPLVTEQFPTGVKLTGYALQSRYRAMPTLSGDAHYPDVEIVPGLTLAACELITPAVSARDDVMHPPSGWVHVRLWWQADGPIADDYIAAVQMVGPEGVWGDRLYRDNEALRRWPTSTWAAGDIMRDEVDVNLNPVTPAGEYPLLVGLLGGAGQPTGERVECGRVTVAD